MTSAWRDVNLTTSNLFTASEPDRNFCGAYVIALLLTVLMLSLFLSVGVQLSMERRAFPELRAANPQRRDRWE